MIHTNPIKVVLVSLFIVQVGWGVLLYRQGQANVELSAQTAELKEALKQENVRVNTLKEGTERAEKALQASIQALGKIPTAQDVAATLTSGDVPPIYSAVAERLSVHTEFREAVRGPQGPQGSTPDIELVAARLVICCAKQLMETFWQNRRNEILQNEGLIASVAQEVYLTYGKDLRGRNGQDGRSVSAAEIAKDLANDLGFAQLIADLKSR